MANKRKYTERKSVNSFHCCNMRLEFYLLIDVTDTIIRLDGLLKAPNLLLQRIATPLFITNKGRMAHSFRG